MEVAGLMAKGNFKPIGIPVRLNLLIRAVNHSTGNFPR